MAVDAAAAAGEDGKAVLLAGRQGSLVADDPSVEAGRRRHQRALEGGERPGNGLGRGMPWASRGRPRRRRRVVRIGEPFHRVLIGGAHLVGMSERQADLLLQTGSASVPHQKRSPGDVPQRRGMAHQRASRHAAAGAFAVRERQLGVVAGRAGDGASHRQPPVIEQALAESELGRRGGVVGRLRQRTAGRSCASAPPAWAVPAVTRAWPASATTRARRRAGLNPARRPRLTRASERTSRQSAQPLAQWCSPDLLAASACSCP